MCWYSLCFVLIKNTAQKLLLPVCGPRDVISGAEVVYGVLLGLLDTMWTATMKSKLLSIKILMKSFKFSTYGSWFSCCCFPSFHQPTSKMILRFFPRTLEWAVIHHWPNTIMLEISLDTRHSPFSSLSLPLTDPPRVFRGTWGHLFPYGVSLCGIFPD